MLILSVLTCWPEGSQPCNQLSSAQLLKWHEVNLTPEPYTTSLKLHTAERPHITCMPTHVSALLLQVQASLTDAALLAPQASPTGLSSSLVVAAQAAWARRQQHRRLIGFQKEVRVEEGDRDGRGPGGGGVDGSSGLSSSLVVAAQVAWARR
jgi:hypothetical protein